MTAGVAAGDQYDPAGTKSHKGPKAGGHKGDLPALNATAKGTNQTVTTVGSFRRVQQVNDGA